MEHEVVGKLSDGILESDWLATERGGEAEGVRQRVSDRW